MKKSPQNHPPLVAFCYKNYKNAAMPTTLVRCFLTIVLLLPLATIAAPTGGTSPQDVITRVVANASEKPLGPVQNDLTSQTIQTANALAKDPNFKDAMGPVDVALASNYNQFALEGPLTSLYSDGPAALFYAKVKLTTESVTTQKELGANNSPGFGTAGGFSDWVGPKVKDDGHVIATFCLVQQNGLWKVHGVYLSNDIIDGSNKDFIVSQLSAFAKKTP